MHEAKDRLEDDPLWYKDAIIYEVHVRSFYDGNGDGIGDFQGLIEKLDYLEDLGINAIWLLPFYPSPLKDDGYDISNYYGVHSDYGGLSDFREFVEEAHKRGIRVITELVLNHTSNQHPWFQKSRRSEPGSKWRDFYVWSDTPHKYGEARIIFQDFESSNWEWDSEAGAYYWHRFYSHQPDLNYNNPKVRERMMDVIDFWLDLGVDGLRLDAVPYLYEREGTNCENLPETHEFLKELRKHVDENFDDKLLLAEANQWPEDAAAYFADGDEVHMAYNFPLMPRMFMSIQMEERFPIIDILEQTPEIPESCQWAIFLRNHDELTLEMVTDEERDYMYRVYADEPQAKINLGIRRRLAPLLDDDRRKIELMNILLFTLPGTPVIYYGDEIGMGDNYYLGDRNGVRTPMQWSPDRNAGFSDCNPQRLFLPVITDPEYHFQTINVESKNANPSSLLWWMKRLIATQKRFSVFGRGDTKFLSPDNPKILAYIREYEDEKVLVVVNLSRAPQAVEMNLSGYAGFTPRELFSDNEFPSIKKDPYILTMTSYDYYCFSLEREEAVVKAEEKVIPTIEVWGSWENSVKGRQAEKLERVLPNYIKERRWFGGKSRDIRDIEITESVPVPEDDPISYHLLLKISYTEGLPDTYQLPVSFISEDGKEGKILEEYPQSVIARIGTNEGEGILYDAVFNEEFREVLLSLIAQNGEISGEKGNLTAYSGEKFEKLREDKEISTSEVLQGEQSNTSFLYENTFFLKLFRRLEKGINPDLEIGKFLTENTDFSHSPEYAGAIEYRERGSNPMVIGMLQEHVSNEGEAWDHALDAVGRYFESVLSEVPEDREVPDLPFSLIEVDRDGIPPSIRELIGVDFIEFVRLLSERTGELHIALSSSNDPNFAPEPFSRFYQRSLYQSIRILVRRVMRSLKRNLESLPEDAEEEVERMLSLEPEILSWARSILKGKISAKKIRIHGDYHLGQVLYTGNDFIIFDFEGEPARSLSERRLKYPPLRDVAGMIRSFHYIAYNSLLKGGRTRPEDASVLEPWADLWYHCVSGIFLDSYLQTVRDSSLLPDERESLEVLLRNFLLEKAVYELGYEIDNRPDWVRIPIRGIDFILGGGSDEER